MADEGQGQEKEADKKIVHVYPLVKHSDMNEEMRIEAIELSMTACEKYSTNYEQAARVIKETMDKKFGIYWHVVVGEGFGFEDFQDFVFAIRAKAAKSLKCSVNHKISACSAPSTKAKGLSTDASEPLTTATAGYIEGKAETTYKYSVTISYRLTGNNKKGRNEDLLGISGYK
ncbi:hypothetical protein GQX74_006116 [Glossina fuscipes]|nr:hypothetical protein GQX74_006116 [Glossina fuscipes]